jgi:hypothetical protein
MRPQLLKQPTVRLHGEHYRGLREGVLRRDGWRCQICGSATNLTVHHQQYRSHSGEDLEQNLITLCTDCHSVEHLRSIASWGWWYAECLVAFVDIGARQAVPKKTEERFRAGGHRALYRQRSR